MQNDSETGAPRLDKTEARQGESRGIVKLLIASLVLTAIAAILLVLYWANGVDAAWLG